MKFTYKSPFNPKNFKDFNPKKFKIYTFNSGFKKRKDDLLVIEFNSPASVFSVYSKTSTPSAPILWDKEHNKGLCKVLIVNSGNANAFTGKEGVKAIDEYVDFASKIFNCKKSNILVSSTGVIGEQINPKKITNKLKLLPQPTSKTLLSAAKSIMTTDTYPKIASETINYKSSKISIYGIAKGSGMIAPNMGTMLSYIFIEAPLKRNDLKYMLSQHITSTFNSISVDGDTSTSDTVMLFGLKSNNDKIRINKVLLSKISQKVYSIMLNLAKQIVSDGEGISKLIEVNVNNALNKNQAAKVSFSIAESLLVKTAIAGEDANWGRIVMAIGKADTKIDQNKIKIKFGNLLVASNGKMNSNLNISKINKYMKNKIIKINVSLGIGESSRIVWSSDLTYTYLKINSDYRS
ncbi:MAG: Arginine biosynthesis bifunctional protein ArgJ [Alphaproteobacteria bacterium MarineAlpha5_Bin6]|nr:MAG: Arginine biosynthesis bifunctional protein ArgJ [Alphaproteobacteria bacterium MarineAlpha5_Bin7]PPR53849.1 MAG: Arginine biosynthesis bifunctional protein ArgJ [Alphaproteobacteria bacterium MarineAlpha5_Bin6]|tara:strand:+ start:104 stop:1321 length:1218 start_codon:yes stop_codon:yes gene_type:complete